MNVSKRLVAALCLACLGYLFLSVEPAPVRAAGDSMSESDFELMRSDIRTKKGQPHRRPHEVHGSGGCGVLAGLSAV
jgi:hypothetical protein